MNTIWAFNDLMLAKALAEHEARLQRDGASEQQAKDETQAIALFLASPEARAAKLLVTRGC